MKGKSRLHYSEKYLWVIFCILMAWGIAWAADTKISDLTADTSPSSDDLIVTVNDPGGTPANRKVTLANLWANVTTLTVGTLLDVNEDIDIDLDNTDEEIDIAQSSGTGTEDVPLIKIDDDRTGATATETSEATIWIDAEGVYAIAAVDGSIYAEGGFEAGASATPSVIWKDSDASDGDDNAQITANATTTTSGQEDIDLDLDVQEAGTMTTKMTIDADGGISFFKDAAAYLTITTADGGATTISQTSDGTDQITIGDGSDRLDIATDTWDVTNGVMSGNSVLYFEFISVSDGRVVDGPSPPAALSTLTSTNSVQIRDFDDEADEDLIIMWDCPPDLDEATGVKINVRLMVSNATGPSNEGVSFFIEGTSLGDGDGLGQAYGTAVESNRTAQTHAQYDYFATNYTAALTSTNITDLAGGNKVFFRLYRDVSDGDDDYAQDIGVAGITLKYYRTNDASF